MESIVAAGVQALAQQRALGNISDNGSSVRDTAPLLGPPDKIDDAQSTDPVEPVRDVVDVDPFAQTAADLQAIIERLGNVASAEDARTTLSDLSEFINNNTNAQFAGGVLSEIGEVVDGVLQALDEDPDAFGNFVSFNFNFQFSQKSLQTEQTSLEATSLSFSFSFVSENTSFSANVSFSEKILQSPGSFQYTSSESANIRVVTNNLDLESNPALEGFVDITNRLLGDASPFTDIFPEPVDEPLLADAGEAAAASGSDEAVGDAKGDKPSHPLLPDLLRERFADLQAGFNIGERAAALLEALFENINGGNPQQQPSAIEEHNPAVVVG